MVAEIWASVMLSFVDQLVALSNEGFFIFNYYYYVSNCKTRAVEFTHIQKHNMYGTTPMGLRKSDLNAEVIGWEIIWN